MSTKQLFIDAFNTRMDQEAAALAERRARLTQRTVTAFRELTGLDVLPEQVIDGDTIILEDEDLALRYNPHGIGSWQVRGLCPDCGEPCWSYDCFGKEDIGAQLTGFQPSHDGHACPVLLTASTSSENWQARLATALAEAIYEVGR